MKVSANSHFTESSPVAQTVKNLPAMQETWIRSLGWEDPLEKGTPVFWPGESHGQRSLAGYSPWGHKQLDMIKQLLIHFTFTLEKGRLMVQP